MSTLTRTRCLAHALAYTARRAIGGRGGSDEDDLEHIAKRVISVSPAAELAVVRPYYRDDQLSMIEDAPWFSARQIVAEHFGRTHITLQPSRLLRLDNAVLNDGSLFVGGKKRIELRSAEASGRGLQRYSLRSVKPAVEMARATLAATVAGSTWFGHWLEDELPQLLLLSQLAPMISHQRAEYGHEPGYRALLALPPVNRVGAARISSLVYLDEFAQNASKAARYRAIRAAIAERPATEQARVFLHRGAAGASRMIRNADAVLELAQRRGFRIVDIDQPLDKLVAALNQAEVVMSVEGSHLAHALYAMRRHGTMIILAPSNRAFLTVAEIAPFCELHAAMFIGQAQDDHNFHVNVEELDRFIDEATADGQQRRGDMERFTAQLIAIDKNSSASAAEEIFSR